MVVSASVAPLDFKPEPGFTTRDEHDVAEYARVMEGRAAPRIPVTIASNAHLEVPT